MNEEEKKIESCEKCDEYLNNWKRAQADYENLRKQLAREKEEFVRFATSQASFELIAITDFFEEAMRHPPTAENWSSWANGIKFIQQQTLNALARSGLKRQETIGKKFDPARHEAVGEKEAEGEAGMILEERAPGYEMNGSVVRPAKVIISKTKLTPKS